MASNSTRQQLTPNQESELKRATKHYKDFSDALKDVGVSGVIPIEFDTDKIGIYTIVESPKRGDVFLQYGLKNIEDYNLCIELADELKKTGIPDKKAERMAYFVVFAHENAHALSQANSYAYSGKNRQSLFNDDLERVTRYFASGKNNNWPIADFEAKRAEIISNLVFAEPANVPIDMILTGRQIEEANSDKFALAITRKIMGLSKDDTLLLARTLEKFRSPIRPIDWESGNTMEKNEFIKTIQQKLHSTGNLTAFAIDDSNLSLSPPELLNKARKDTMQNLIPSELSNTLSGLSDSELQSLIQKDEQTSLRYGCKNDISRNSEANNFLRNAAKTIDRLDDALVLAANAAQPIPFLQAGPALNSLRNSKKQLQAILKQPEDINLILNCGIKPK